MSVSLTKKQTVSLAKSASNELTRITIGLGWDPVKKKKGLLSSLFSSGGDSIDLDASCVLLDGNAQPVDTIWFRQLKSRCGAVVHGGDNLTGAGDGDDEVIHVDLPSLPSSVEYLAFTVNSFRGQTFNEVENAFCRVLDNKGTELAKFLLAEQGSHTGVLIASLRRQGGEWNFTAHGQPAPGRTVDDMIPMISQQVGA
ncbi:MULTISPECIES: TerD family protein [Oceanisphaera]|uniref:TerD family protein n=1 Tax=Oceanisphaera ostreae TaxID=914151 RepID=A0ABW3KMV1_9GAMM